MTDGNPKVFEALKLTEVEVSLAWRESLKSARQFKIKSSGLSAIVTNEEKTNGYAMLVWHPSRWPTLVEIGLLKQALMPDDVAIGIPFGTKQEIDQQKPFNVYLNQFHNMKDEKVV
jgi:hypothetical protein